MNGYTAIFISVKRLHFLASNFSLDNYQKTFVGIFSMSITLFLILPNYCLSTCYKVFQEDCNVIHRVIFLLINRLHTLIQNVTRIVSTHYGCDGNYWLS